MDALNWIKFLIILNLCNFAVSVKSRDLYFYDIRSDYNPKFGNASVDMTMRANNTRTHPSRFLAAVKFRLLLDVTNINVGS